MKSVISNLHLKFAEKTWNETFQLVRRCMEKPRDESKPCEPLVRSLERLQEAFNVSSMHTMRSRLEMIAKQQGLGFHVTDAACYLTADLFYLEVVLLPCGGVEEVKVAPHGAPAVASERLLQLLRSKNFAGFSVKLAGLFSQYNIPGDREVQLKLFTSLQCLGKDLELISQLPRLPTDPDPHVDIINNGRIGHLIAGKADYPLTIEFYIPPSDAKKTSDSQMPDVDPVVQTAQVTVGVSSVTHTLQMASVVPQPPQLDPEGCPAFLSVNEVPSEALPACFLLRLQPAIPVTAPLLKKLGQITDVVIPDVGLQWAPLSKLLMRGLLDANILSETLDEQDIIFKVSFPGVTQSFILPGAAWEEPDQRATVMHSIPFTHPAHLPAVVELLRRQCALNTLLGRCIGPQRVSSGSLCDLHCEVLPHSDTGFSVTFQRPEADTLAVLLVNLHNSLHIKCSLFGAGETYPAVDEYISTVMKMCMSVPVTLQTLCSKWSEITSDHLATTDANNDSSSPWRHAPMDTDSTITTYSQVAAVPEDDCAASPSSSSSPVAKTDLLPETNRNPDATSYPVSPGGVYSQWTGGNDPEPI